jgi:hypothetical protein
LAIQEDVPWNLNLKKFFGCLAEALTNAISRKDIIITDTCEDCLGGENGMDRDLYSSLA